MSAEKTASWQGDGILSIQGLVFVSLAYAFTSGFLAGILTLLWLLSES